MVNSTTLRNGSKSRRYNLRSIARVDYSQIRKTVKKSSPPKKEDKGAISVNREIKTEPGIELPSTSKSSLVFHENGSVKRKRQTEKEKSNAKKIKLEPKEEHLEKKKVQVEKGAHINRIPIFILGMILRKVSVIERLRAERVCRRWKYAAINYGWKNMTTISYKTVIHIGSPNPKFIPAEITNSHISVLLQRTGKYLRKLNIGSFKTDTRARHITVSVTYRICSFFHLVPNVVNLILSNIQLTNSTLALIGRQFPRLIIANFCKCFQWTKIDRGMGSFLASCRELRYLILGENKGMTGTSFCILPPTLRCLSLRECYGLDRNALTGIRQNCANLTELVFDRVDTVSANDLNIMFGGLKELQILHFSDIFHAGHDDTSLTGLGLLQNIKDLHLSSNLLVNDNALRAISTGCRRLELLDISQCSRNVTDAGLRSLTNLPYLTELRLMSQRYLTNETLRQFARRGRITTLCVRRCQLISDESIVYLINNCKSLNSLDIAYCVGVTKKSLEALSAEMVRRHGQTLPDPDDCPEKLFKLYSLRSGISSARKCNPWIRIFENFDHDHADNFAALLFAHLPMPFIQLPAPGAIQMMMMP